MRTTSAAAALLLAVAVVVTLALNLDEGTAHPLVLAAPAYGGWLCHLGWNGEGCADAPRYMPGEIRSLQKDNFDSRFKDVFDKWEKSTGRVKKLSERLIGCDGVMGSAKTIDGCGVCGGKGGKLCATKPGIRMEYWGVPYALDKIPVNTKRAMRIWGEYDNSGRLGLTARSDFHVDRGQRFSTRYTGLLKVPKEDTYGFILRSADGSRLFIDNRLIVDNDGSHRKRPVSGVASLTKGYHEVRVEYFSSGKRSPYLRLQWESDSMKRKLMKLRLRKNLTLQAPPKNLSRIELPPSRRAVVRSRAAAAATRQTKKKPVACPRVSVRNWQNVPKIVRVCAGQTLITSQSVRQATTKQCLFGSDYAGVQMDAAGKRYRAVFRARCGGGVVYGVWSDKGRSVATFKLGSASAILVPPRKAVNVCKDVEAKDWKNKSVKTKICSGQYKILSQGNPQAVTTECKFRRTQSGIEMDKYGRIRAFYRNRCSKKGAKVGKWMRVGVSTARWRKQTASVRVITPVSPAVKRTNLCENRVRYMYRSILKRAADPSGFKLYVRRCVAGTTDDEMRKSIMASDEYKRKFGGTRFLNGGGRIQSGTTWWGIFRTNDWRLMAGKGVRTSCHDVRFSTPFQQPPRVSVYMYAVDLVRASDYYRVKIESRDVRNTGMKVCFTTWVDSKVYSIGVSWVAVDATLVGADKGVVSSRSGNSHPLMSGTNAVEESDVKFTGISSTPAVLYGFQHLDLWRGQNLRVNSYAHHIRRHGLKMAFQTWAGSKIWQMSNSYLALDREKMLAQGLVVRSGAFTPTAAIQPRLWPMARPSTRVYDHCVKFRRPFRRPPKVVAALRQLDAAKEYNVRAVANVHAVTKDGFCVEFRTWHTTQIWSMGVSWMAYTAK